MEVYRKSGDKEPLFKCRTRNIGFGGTMIRNRGIKLRKGARLKILLKASCRSGLKQLEMDAKVLWKTPTAIGFEFYPTKLSKHQEFKRFLFEAKVGSHIRNLNGSYLKQKSAHMPVHVIVGMKIMLLQRY
jgi:hypothetical protein